MCAMLISKTIRLARVNKGSHSFTRHPHVNPHVESAKHHWHISVNMAGVLRRTQSAEAQPEGLGGGGGEDWCPPGEDVWRRG